MTLVVTILCIVVVIGIAKIISLEQRINELEDEVYDYDGGWKY